MRRLTGLDLNGWHDKAARDWVPEEPDFEIDVKIVDGGLESVAVREDSGQWTGGPQAALAPHGRGGGWGAIGSSERRVSLTSEIALLLGGEDMNVPEAYAAAARALAYGADEAVVAVPDRPEFDEAAQGRLLCVFKQTRRRHRLLWRPVALFLDALQRGMITREQIGRRIRLLIHSGDGLEVQILHLRADPDHPGHMAPEREGYGHVVLPELGLAALCDRANDAVHEANPLLGDGKVERSRLAMKLLCGEAAEGDSEILRRENGTWLEVQAPALSPEALYRDTHVGDGHEDEEPVAATVLATPLRGAFADFLATKLAQRWPELITQPWESIARGALRAGRLIEHGLPHYFDKLEPIALAVLRGDEPQFADLIDQAATVPANREYISPPYRGLSWRHGKTAMEFYIVKSGHEIRHWHVLQDDGPQADVDVELRLRQTPGQSWAKLAITSSEWEQLSRSPIFLDWDKLTPIELTPEEVLERLRPQPPTIPERIVEGTHLWFWSGGEWFRYGLLDAMEQRGAINPKMVVPHLRRQRRDPDTGERVRPVGTDGAFPVGLDESAKTRFLGFLDSVAEMVTSASERDPPSDNDPVACLTWSFTLCPEPAQEAIIKALEAHLTNQAHPLLAPKFALRVLIQGSGRAVTGVDRLRRVLHVLAARPMNNDTINALAMVLTRRAEAPHALSAELVDTFFEGLADALLTQVRHESFKTLFRNTLSALAGMFRWREIEPYALLADRDVIAIRVRETLVQAGAELARRAARVPQVQEKQEKIAAIIEYLDGKGDPNILHQIENDGD